MKSLNMKAFVDIGFDCEWKYSISDCHWKNCSNFKMISKGHLIGLFKVDGFGEIIRYMRPRLNRAQVLDDYSKVLIDGLVWRVHYDSYNGKHTEDGLTSTVVKGIIDIIWLECIGLEDKPEWREESERLAMPLIKVEGWENEYI